MNTNPSKLVTALSGLIAAFTPSMSEATSLRPAFSSAVERVLESNQGHDDLLVEVRGSRSGGRWSRLSRIFQSPPPADRTPPTHTVAPRWSHAPSPAAPARRPSIAPTPGTQRTPSAIGVLPYSLRPAPQQADDKKFWFGQDSLSGVNLYYTGLAATQLGLAQFVPESAVDELAASQYAQFLGSHRHSILSRNDPLASEVEKIFRWLIAGTPEIKAANPEIRVFNDLETANAWCMPGFKVTVFTGLIKRLKHSTDMTAAILAHEIAHADLKHGYRAFRENLITQGIYHGLIGQSRTTGAALASVIGGGALRLLTTAHFSQEHEIEADIRAIAILRNAGYDAWMLVNALAYFQGYDANLVQGIFSRYPNDPDRILHDLKNLPVSEPHGANRKTETGLLDSHPATPERIARVGWLIMHGD